MDKYVIIVAGGSGSRMNSDMPKQFLLLKKRPVLMHTMEVFYSFDASLKIILVLPENHISTWEQLKEQYSFDVPHTIAIGGDSRFASVKNGLQSIKSEGLVAIHDGARPLVTSAVIERTFQLAETSGNAIAAVALKDSIRETKGENNWSVNRDAYQIIQTPQTFKVAVIKEAFQNANPKKQYTDDASVLEDLGKKINLTQGSYDNIKITTPEDLAIADTILTHRK